jgi:hypothetical protein
LGGRKSRAGAAFAAVRHPMRSLRQAFGRDLVARDAAENFTGMSECKYGFQLVFATLNAWNRTYRGPRISSLFAAMNRSRVGVVDTHKPEFD